MPFWSTIRGMSAMADAWAKGRRIVYWQSVLRSAIVDSESFYPSDRVVTRFYHGWLGDVTWTSAGGATKVSFVISAVGTTRVCVTITGCSAEIPVRELGVWADRFFSSVAERADVEYSHAGAPSAAIFKKKGGSWAR